MGAAGGVRGSLCRGGVPEGLGSEGVVRVGGWLTGGGGGGHGGGCGGRGWGEGGMGGGGGEGGGGYRKAEFRPQRANEWVMPYDTTGIIERSELCVRRNNTRAAALRAGQNVRATAAKPPRGRPERMSKGAKPGTAEAEQR